MTPRHIAAFVSAALPLSGRSSCIEPSRPIHRHAKCPPTMAVKPGIIPTSSGGAILTLLLVNRLITPLSTLSPQQSRADLIGVATAATLLLYGLTRLEITPTNEPVVLDGVDIRQGFSDTSQSQEIEWALQACLRGGEHVQSVALIGPSNYLLGRFRNGRENDVGIVDGGIVAGAMRKGEKAYLADMKVVSAKEVEFGYLPERVQAALIVPIGEYALVLGANKPRPFKGVDFGWIQAIADRIGSVVESG